MAKELGFGLLGAGLVSPFHAKSIREVEGGRLIAICDNEPRTRGQDGGGVRREGVYALDEMLKDPALTSSTVVTPNHLHYAAVMQCAKAGKHVITEKPPAMSLKETDEMIAACAKAGLKFGCTVQCRVRKAVQAIRSAVASGRFGKVLHADTYMKWFRATEYYQSDPWRSSRQSGAGVTFSTRSTTLTCCNTWRPRGERRGEDDQSQPSVGFSWRTRSSRSSPTPAARRAWCRRLRPCGRERTSGSKSTGPTYGHRDRREDVHVEVPR